MVGLIGCSEMSVRKYYHTLRNSPEERSSYVAVLPLSGSTDAQCHGCPAHRRKRLVDIVTVEAILTLFCAVSSFGHVSVLSLHHFASNYEGKSNEKIKYFFILYQGRYGVLIHDSYPDVQLFHSTLRGDFPSRWLQLLQCPLVSLMGVPDQFEDSLLQN